MPDIALTAELRADKGSPASRRARGEGRIPAVIYGHGHDPLAISVDARELRTALSAQSGGSVLFSVSVDAEDHLVIAREVQRHPVRHTVAHVDFQVVSRDEVIPADVSIHLVGNTVKVTRAGGVVEHALLNIRVYGKPADIPSSIEVDVEDLEIGTTIRVSDLTLPAGVTIDLDPDTPVVVAAAPHGEVVEGEEGAEAVESGATAEAASTDGEESEAADETSDEN
jgi:large subunit ribosomal protein L25